MPSVQEALTMEPVRVTRFRADGPSVQVYHCDWRGTDRVLRYKGPCVACRSKTWGADDGENDPRGILGDHATHALVASEYDMVGPDVALCAMCGNESGPYHAALRHAERVAWKRADSETVH